MRLLSLGIEIAHEQTVADDLDRLTSAIQRALRAYPLVIVTGGLGPTFDDLARAAAAAATGRPLKRSPQVLQDLNVKFKSARYKVMPPMNARQADVLEGAYVLKNLLGTAPGQWLELPSEKVEEGTLVERRVLILLPGPPRELKPMLERDVLPRLKKTFKTRPRAEGHLHFAGIAESLADQKIRPVISKYRNAKGIAIDFTILAHFSLLDFDVFVEADTSAIAEHTVAEIMRKVERPLRQFCYGKNDDYPLEKIVGQALRRSHATLAVAESCTGGMLSAQLTGEPGSSDYFLGGSVVYANRLKETELNLPHDLIEREGAVSSGVARALAEGIRRKMQSSYGLGITGIAGPGGAMQGKPVGLVFVGIATPRGTPVKKYLFSGARDVVRARAVTAALDMLRQELLVKNKHLR